MKIGRRISAVSRPLKGWVQNASRLWRVPVARHGIAASVGVVMAVMPSLSLASPCVLVENCPDNLRECAHETLTIEIVSATPAKISTNFGSFDIEKIVRAGATISKIKSGDTDLTFTTQNDLVIASYHDEKTRRSLNLVVDSPNHLTATLIENTQRYVDYPQGRRVFSGSCDKAF
ncbi:MAG: hypothetical protein ABJQ23_17600 [Shimia thalassica]|uniref:hypothetical protein n=1 Tax=Shimia thalassica TaxID=1715693 RepID=UPI003297FC86